MQWFVQLLSELQAERAKDIKAHNVESDNTLSIHIFVTSVKEDHPVPQLLEAASLPERLTPHAKFLPHDLLAEMIHPSAKSSDFTEVSDAGCHCQTLLSMATHVCLPQTLKSADAPNRLQDVHVWDGRPDWDQVFARVSLVVWHPADDSCNLRTSAMYVFRCEKKGRAILKLALLSVAHHSSERI